MKYKDSEWLRTQYIDNQRSMSDIAKELNVSTSTIKNHIDKLNIEVRNKNIQRSISMDKEKKRLGVKRTMYSSKPKNKYLADKQWLEDKYCKELLSLRDISEILGLKGGRRTIKRALIFHAIPIRDLKDARNVRSNKGPEFRYTNNKDANDLDLIKKMYESGKSINDICKELNISQDAVRHRIKAAKVQVRKSSEHRIGKKHSSETIEKMSKTAVEQILSGERSTNQRGINHIVVYNDKIFRVRSTYEKVYAEYLKKNNIEFEYEATSFSLSNGKTYVPDFYIPSTDTFVEIKGVLSDAQKQKYDIFKSEYPNIKWNIMYKEDLENLQIDVSKLPTVYLLVGAPASGKSWVANQLIDKFDYISYDGNRKKTHLDLLRVPSTKPKLYDPTFKISTVIRRHSDEFNFIIVAIQEDEPTLRARMAERGGKWTDTIMKRNEQVRKRFEKYGNDGFIGNSSDVLVYLSSLVQ